MTRIITITGSRDGVGKTTLTTGLAKFLAGRGQRVCLLALLADSDLRTMAGATLSDRLSGAGGELAVCTPEGFDLVLGGGRNWLRDLSGEQMGGVADVLQTLGDYDFLLIDAGADTEQNQLAFSLASPELLVVITPDKEHLSDTYGLLKLLYAEQYDGRISVVVNKSENHTVGRHAYDKLREVTSYYLDLQLPLAGLVGELAGAGATATRTVDIDDVVAYLLAEQGMPASSGIPAYTRRLLAAVGGSTTVDNEKPLMPVFAQHRPDHDFREQLDVLSSQIDDLIAEVGRLRRQDTRQETDLLAVSGAPATAVAEDCHDACIAEIASGSERVSVDGQNFSIYYLRKPNGEQQRFACHSIDDDLEEPTPQSRLS